MIVDILLLIVGLALILVGANILTDGAAAIAKKWGVSDLVVGLTVVAFGTSAPELVISMLSAINGSAELAIGNVVGSNIFNLLVIIGATALIRPIVVTPSVLTNDIPLVLLSSLALLVMANGPLLDHSAMAEISRVDGILLLLFFAIFMRYTFAQAHKADPQVGASDPSAVQAAGKPLMPMWKSLLFVVGGLAGLIIGGNMFVDNASSIARALGVSDAVIALTIVAAGTSLPELATSVTAALKGKTEIALGNVIGSNIFNIFLVLGASATIRPLPLGTITNLDLLTLMLASVLFLLFAGVYRTRTITRPEALIMLLIYPAYLYLLL